MRPLTTRIITLRRPLSVMPNEVDTIRVEKHSQRLTLLRVDNYVSLPGFVEGKMYLIILSLRKVVELCGSYGWTKLLLT